MAVYRSRPLPVVTLHRDAMLNGDLSATSRLLYAILVCSLDVDLDYEEIATLVGAKNADDLKSYLEELVSVGAVEMGEHVGKGPVLTVHEIPLVPEQRTHVCVPCEECGDCSCAYIKGICQPCYYIRDTYAQAKTDVARWKAQLEAGATYAMGQNATRLHRWDCPTLATPEKSMANLEEQKPHAKLHGVYWHRLPTLYTAEELRQKGARKRHCAICGPDPL